MMPFSLRILAIFLAKVLCMVDPLVYHSAEDEGVEPTNRLRDYSLANCCLTARHILQIREL